MSLKHSIIHKYNRHWPHLVAWGLVLAFIVTFTWLAVQRHKAFLSGFDLGVYNQVVWNTLHGRIYFYTSTGQPLLHLSNHADFILLLLAPFYLIYNGPEILLFLQAVLIGLAGMPVFWLGREKLNSDLAGLSLLAAYLLFPGTEIVTLSDFHPPALAFAFLMFAFYFLEKQKEGRFLLFVILAMACKEQIPLQVIFLGLYALIRRRNWRLGLTTIFLGTAWFVAVMYWVIPAYSVVDEHIFLHFYAEFGDTPLKIVTTILTRPDLVLKNLWQPAKLAYLRDIFIPFAFLPFFGLPVLLVGLPSFAINLLSANPAMYNATRGHYVADVTPWLVWGTLFGMVYLSDMVKRLKIDPIFSLQSTSLNHVLSLILLVVSITWHLFNGFSPLAFNAPRWEITDHDRLGQRFIAQIPPDAPISAQIKLYSHLSHRTIAYVFPHVFEADYILLDVTSDTSPLHPYNYRDEIETLLESGEFGILDAEDGYLLLQRDHPNAILPDAFYNFARVEEAAPQYPVEAQFGDSVRLLGFDVLDDPRSQETSVRLYWQSSEPIKDELRLYPFFINPAGDVIEDTSSRPMTTQIWYPPEEWQPGEIVVTETLPWDLGDEWSLAVGVLAGPDWSDWTQRLSVRPADGSNGQVRRFEAGTWVRLATFERRGRHYAEVTPPEQDWQPSTVVEANLGDSMLLHGYDVSFPAGKAGQEVTVTLYWQALAPMAVDYTVFVHLVGPDGQLVAQHDGQPWWQVPIPTSTWQPGERLQDCHQLELPSDLPPGTYHLRLGVYYWQTLERLPVVEGDLAVSDHVELGSIAIE